MPVIYPPPRPTPRSVIFQTGPYLVLAPPGRLTCLAKMAFGSLPRPDQVSKILLQLLCCRFLNFFYPLFACVLLTKFTRVSWWVFGVSVLNPFPDLPCQLDRTWDFYLWANQSIHYITLLTF